MIVASALCVVACAATGRPALDSADSMAGSEHRRVLDSVIITLERTPCLGACPVYALAIAGDGAVTYEGKAYVSRLGTVTDTISKQQVEALISEFERADFFSFADRYAFGEPTCAVYIVDLPSVIMSVTIKGRTKRVEHDPGCEGAHAS